ncbi:MAG: hypothetical protein QXI07_09540 [Pyrobaculum sp.]
MTNVYLGPDSWYARHGLPYCRGQGVNPATARCIAKKILRELRQGWTFDKQTGKRIRMTPELARKRLTYLIALARKHGGNVEGVRRVVARALRKIRTARKTPA